MAGKTYLPKPETYQQLVFTQTFESQQATAYNQNNLITRQSKQLPKWQTKLSKAHEIFLRGWELPSTIKFELT